MLLYTRHLIINFFETFVEKSCFDFELCVLRSFDPLDPASLQMTFFTTQVNTILWLRKVLTSKELVTKRCYIHLQLPMSTTKDIWNRFTDQGTPPSKKTEADQFMSWQPSSKSQVTKGCTYFFTNRYFGSTNSAMGCRRGSNNVVCWMVIVRLAHRQFS